MVIGNRLKELRESKQLSQGDIGRCKKKHCARNATERKTA